MLDGARPLPTIKLRCARLTQRNQHGWQGNNANRVTAVDHFEREGFDMVQAWGQS
ncbi:hypothetical protein ACWENS_23545 [Streptomyces sp. NPDC004532]